MFERVKAWLAKPESTHLWLDPTGVLLKETPGFDCIVCGYPGYECMEMSTCPRFEGFCNSATHTSE